VLGVTRIVARLECIAWAAARLGRAGGGRALGPLACWVAWERLAAQRARLRAARPGAMLRYRLTAHRGPPRRLRDGTLVRPGDPVVELHVDSAALIRAMHGRAEGSWAAFRAAGADLRALAELARDGSLGRAVALRGLTLLTAPAARLGFEITVLPRTARYWPLHFFFVGLVAVHHPRGWAGAEHWRRHSWPGELWMSAARLRAFSPTRPVGAAVR
jgi:hypothetical protein